MILTAVNGDEEWIGLEVLVVPHLIDASKIVGGVYGDSGIGTFRKGISLGA